MGHIRILTKPIVRLYIQSFLVLGTSGKAFLTRLFVLYILRFNHFPVFNRFLVPVTEEENTGSKEVDG